MNNDFTGCDKPLSAQDLQRFERKLGIVFPDDFKSHYLRFNGGVPARGIWTAGLAGEAVEVFHFLPMLDRRADGSGCFSLNFVAREAASDGTLPPAWLPFATDVDGNFFCLNLADAQVFHFRRHDASEAVSVEENWRLHARWAGNTLPEFVNALMPAPQETPRSPERLHTVQVPGLGSFTKDLDDDTGWYYSEAMPMPLLDGRTHCFVVDGYDDDAAKDELHTAMANFLSIDRSVLVQVEPQLFRYYQDCSAHGASDDAGEPLQIASPSQIWEHIQLGHEPMVTRSLSNGKVYVSLASHCDWEPEHGLQIVFENGLRVSKLGPCDGHCTHSSGAIYG